MDQTQVMVGNFPAHVKAEDLAAYLQRSLGIVDRCKVKCIYRNTPPHAFVQFMSAAVAREACSESGLGRLKFEGCELKIIPCTVQPKSKVSHEGIIELRKVQLQVGTLTGLHELLVSWRVSEHGCSLRLNRKHRKIYLFFTHEVVMSTNLQERELCEFRLEMSVRDVRKVSEVQTQRGRMPELMMVLQLWSPPLISYRTAQGDDVYCTTHSPLPEDDDPWIRTIDFTPRNSIGRCLAYAISVSPINGTPFRQLLEFFRIQRIFDRTPPRRLNCAGEDISCPVPPDLFFVPDQSSVPFSLMFLVNALVNRGIVNTTGLTGEFYATILDDPALSRYAMQHMLTYTFPVFNAVHRIQQVKAWAQKYGKDKEEVKMLRSGSMMVYRVVITPTRAYCAMPVREMSNRVLRHFHVLSDRFLRVSFMDDDLHQLPASGLTVPVAPIVRTLSSAPEYHRTELFKRVLNIVKTGFHLCGRHYEFLAFSSSQVREASAWFFAGNYRWNANQIRRWMGQFPTQNVAKFAARMGQCFSSTFLTLPVPQEKVMTLRDVERNGYVFSDGCGRVTPEFAFKVSEILNLAYTPSVYQIRYAGCKGVVASWPIESPSGHQYDLGIRKSMTKFSSDHTELEVIGWSKYLPCYLNRQIICLLSTLLVQNAPFKQLQDLQVARLEAILEDPGLAYEVLTTSCTGDVHSTAATMLLGGFHPKKEPHLYDMLLSIRTSQLEDLVAKARIFVPDGRWLMGCMDETGLLNYGQCFIRVSGPAHKGSLGEGDGFNLEQRSETLQVITGKVIMAKNPCLHPGDIRILEAVDVPQLHSMIDCLVVPQNGPRPHPNEASGSDLDGDVYFTCWDPDLIPPSGESWDPMVYNAHEQRFLSKPAKIEDVMEFFVRAMINDSLGVICNAHVVHADRSPLGALDENCLLLSQLAATAVDFPKTGKVATMPYNLRIKEFPDFMEKDEEVTYQSEKVIGELYRSVTKFVSQEVELLRHADHAAELDPAYDTDLLVLGYELYLEDAWKAKVLYDQQLRGLMSHFNIKREADIITGRMHLQARGSSRHKAGMKDRMMHAYAGLKKEFQTEFYKSVANAASASCTDDSSMDAAESNLDFQAKLASAMYHVTYDREWKLKALALLVDSEDADERPLLSFPWIAAPVLAQIKSMKLRYVLEAKKVV